MANSNKRHVAVIESSLIIREGLKNILSEIEGIASISLSPGLELFARTNDDTQIDYLIINPSFLYNETKSSMQTNYPVFKRSKLIALVYNYVNQSILNQFDDFICVDDSKESISDKLKKLAPPANEADSHDPDHHIDLSDREKEILVSLTKGKTNKEIAEEHCISIHTVISHRKNISRKTGIRSVSGLTIYALLNKLIVYSDIE